MQRLPQYSALVASLDDETLYRIASEPEQGDIFLDAVLAEINEAKIRVGMPLDVDQQAIAEYTAGLLGHVLERDAVGAYMLPTPLRNLRERLADLRIDIARHRLAAA